MNKRTQWSGLKSGEGASKPGHSATDGLDAGAFAQNTLNMSVSLRTQGTTIHASCHIRILYIGLKIQDPRFEVEHAASGSGFGRPSGQVFRR